MLGNLIGQLGVPLLSQSLADGLGQIDHPVAQQAAEALESLDGEVKGGAISAEALQQASQEMAKLKRVQAENQRAVLAAVNETIRAEMATEDAFVRRMRPTFGYILALSWLAQMGAVAYTIVAAPERAGSVIADIAELSAMWSVGLSVLGVYVYKRSQEKGALGGSAVSAVKGLAGKLAGDGGTGAR